MKHFSKQISWLLAYVIIITSIVSTGIPVYAATDETVTTIGENTDEVIVAGTDVGTAGWSYPSITYYESADSETILYESRDYYKNTIGSDNIASKPYAWHIKYIKSEIDPSRSGATVYYFKAYPDTSLEKIPVNTQMTLPEGTKMTLSAGTPIAASGSAINVSVNVGGTKLTDYKEASFSFTLPSESELRSDVVDFDKSLEEAGYHLPDLTKLYYTVELIDKSEKSYSLKLTLVPTVEITFSENVGTPDLAGTTMHATPSAAIESINLPTFFLEGKDFYGLENGGKYAYLANVTKDNITSLVPVSSKSKLKIMYQDKKPTFKLDLANKKVTNLLKEKTYYYEVFEYFDWYTKSKKSDASGEFSYEGPTMARFCLASSDTNVENSEYVYLKHSSPNIPVVEHTATTAKVTNIDDFAGCEFAIRATSDYSDLSWGTSSTFSGLTPEKEYNIYVKHLADKNGFESDPAKSLAFRTAKAVSNDAPNGVTIADIPDQTHTGSVIEPTLMIKDSDKTLVLGTDYIVAYSNNTNVGTATATVTFMDSYSGTMTKNFTIVPALLVSFDGNGGTGTMENVSVSGDEQYTLPACTFTAPASKTFKAWNIGGTEYAPGDSYTVTADTTITAVWKDIEKVKTPTISPNGGTFMGSQTVTITCGTADAKIYYTTDGTAPTTESTLYSKPFTIRSSSTVKAIAVNDGMADSDIALASFTVNYTLVFDDNGGTGTMENVSVSNGEQYTLPACTFTAPANKIFKAWKIGENEYAPGDNYTVTADTTIIAVWKDIEKVKTPTISPNGGTFNSSQTVTITCETADAKIYYTTDGTAPTTGSTEYSTPFTINSSSTIKAIAVKDDMYNSDLASASFTKRSSNSGGSTTPTPTPTPPSYTVIFNTDGGSTIDAKRIKEGSTIGEIPAPTKKDYVFEGWYSDKELTKAYDANTKITASTTLYAKWTKVEPKPVDNTKNELILTIGKKEATAFGSTKTNDVAPIIQNGKPMLPARFVAESLGAKVTWNGQKRLVTIKGKNEKGKNVTIRFYIGSKYATVNGKKVKLESPAFQKNRRVYTPMKFIAENLGASVKWNKATKQVVITKK